MVNYLGVSSRAYTEDELGKIDPEPIEYEGKQYSCYDAAQKQRAMERSIRKTKREIAAADGFGDTDTLRAKSIYLRGQKAKYKDFSKKAGLRVKNERLQELKFGRKVSRKVTATTERHHKDWLKSIGAENSSLNTLEKYYQGKYTNSEEYRLLKIKNKDAKLLDKIKREYNLTVHEGKQGKHIKGHNNYAGKSYLLDDIDPQALVNQYAGTGEIVRTDSGRWIGKQFFTHENDIGVNVDPKTGKETKTNYFSIDYSKEKGTHIVPRFKK